MKIISIIFKSIIVILALFGILVQIGLFDNELVLTNLNYYTLISNLLCSIYFTIDIIYIVKGKDIFCPIFKALTTMGITVTMLVVIVFLRDLFPTSGLNGLSFNILHYIVPIMVILDWIIFDKKGSYKKYYPLTNIIFPFLYYIYVVIIVGFGYRFSVTNKYPYPFMNIDELGVTKVLLTNIITIIFFLGLGYIYYFIDRLLDKKS